MTLISIYRSGLENLKIMRVFREGPGFGGLGL